MIFATIDRCFNIIAYFVVDTIMADVLYCSYQGVLTMKHTFIAILLGSLIELHYCFYNHTSSYTYCLILKWSSREVRRYVRYVNITAYSERGKKSIIN